MEQAKNYLVIGGTHGIGEHVTRKLCAEGHRVWIWARHANEALYAANLTFVQNDVNAASYNMDTLPDVLHGFVYCPGTINLKPFHRFTEEDFLNDLKVNLIGAVRTTQAVLPALKKSRDAAIVYFSTVAVAQGMGFHASIASAKGAIEGLTRSLAAELAPTVRVNAVAPSLTDTPLAAKLLATEEKKELAQKRHPLQRYGNAENIASLVCFLLSNNSDFITGQILHADGGLSSVRA